MLQMLIRSRKKKERLFEQRVLDQYQLLRDEWRRMLSVIEYEGPYDDELWIRYRVAEEEYCEIIRYLKRLKSDETKESF